MSETKQETFHLGLTMAGAVTAGSYTGGVLDYLFEALDKWERAKKGELEGVDIDDVPKHSVVIDAMGGASAGGMTTSMAVLYALKNQVNPVTDAEKDRIGEPRNNIFYDSWVNLVDNTNEKTIEKALTTHDLQRDGILKSMLNSDFIDEIANKAFKIEGDPGTNPAEKIAPYISKDLQLIISHTMLKGVPLEVTFTNNSSLKTPPSHSSYEHLLLSHFKLNNGKPINEDHYLWLNPYNEKAAKQLMLATIATGAFPLGLSYRRFDETHFGKEYIKSIISRLISRKMGEDSPEIKARIKWKDELLTNYSSLSVDGGAINNEPFGEVLSILKHNHHQPTIEKDEKVYQKYGMVMIDPFPDFHFDDKKNGEPKSLLGVAPAILQTLRNQAKIKRSEMIEQFDNDAYRGVIYPVKYKVKNNRIIKRYDYPIATGMLGGFSGLIDIKYRHHDFYLGRNNARNFIRAFLSLPYNPEKGEVHPIHLGWTNEQRKLFLITINGKNYLPILPDMNMLLDGVSSAKERLKYTFPDPPKIPKSNILALKSGIKVRIKAIINLYLKPQKAEKQVWYKRAISALPNWVKRSFIALLRNWGANKVADIISEKIIAELCKGDFIDDPICEKLKKTN